MVGVGEAVRVGAQAGDERPLLERQHDRGRPGHGQVALDRLPALRVCGRVRLAVDHPHADPGGRRDAADEGGARVERRPHLEVRRARPAERACAEEGAAEIRRAAARARDHPAGRPVERQPLGAEDARLPQDVDRMRGPVDEELRRVARSNAWLPVGADLRLDPQPPEDRERPPRDGRLRQVEVERSSPRPRRWTVPAVWKSAESSARRSHRRSGRATRARRGRRRRASPRSEQRPLEREQAALEQRPPGP